MMKFKKYPDDYNPILEYNSKIQSSEIVACEKLKKTFQKIVYDINNPDEFFYSQKRANHVLEFFENYCHHSKGKMGGKLVELELWEKAILCTIFGFVNIEGVRKYQRAVLIVGKKNGKSLLASGVGLYLQIADSEAGAEVYAVATKRDQAKIIWLEAKKMVKKSPMLARKIKPLVSELNSDFNDSVFKPLSSDSDTLDGLNVHGALLDEIHQWKNGKELYDIITYGITAREQPLVFITSTAGTVREDIYDTIYDEGKRTINGYFDENGYKDERSIFFIYEKEVQDDLDIYPFAVGYDSWSATYWVEDMKNTFGNIMIEVNQGKKTLSSPMKSLGADLESKIINYNNNPIDKWCFANVSYEEDKNGNIQPCKTSKATRRIDGFASLLDAYVVLEDKKEEYESLI